MGQGYQVNKAIFKKGDYKLENKKDNEGYLLEALEAKAYNFQQLYLTMYSDYIKFYNDTNREIFKLEDKFLNEYDSMIESKIGRLLLIQEDRKKRINNTIESLKRVGYLKEEAGLYYDEWGSLWATFEIVKPNIEVVEVNDFADMFEVW